jgi:4-amino-4-deoxy-L-arabinose transferase-like glycosyltransferase
MGAPASHRAAGVEPAAPAETAEAAGAGSAPGAGRLRPGRRSVGRFEIGLGLIALAGLAWRAAYVIVTRHDTSLCGQLLCGDALYYSAQANTIGLGHWFVDYRNYAVPTADHPPMTALVVAPMTLLFGGTNTPVTQQRLLMAVLGAAVIVAIGYLGRRVGGAHADRVGLIAAGIAAVNANLWMNDVLVMSETLAALAVAVTLLAVYRFVARPTLWVAAAVGALVGLAGLTRAELLLLLPVTFVPVALWARSLSIAGRLGRIALAAVVTLAVLVPWTAYNRTRFTDPVLLSTNDGLTLVGANCDDVYGVSDPGGKGFWQLQCAVRLEPTLPPGADQSVVSSIYRSDGLRYIADHKQLLPGVEAVRLGRAWGVFDPDQMVWLNQGEGRTAWASWLGYAEWWVLAPLAVAGIVVLRRRRTSVWPLASTAIIVTITAMVFYGIVRFRLAADVGATVLAAVALDAAWMWFRSRRHAGAPDVSVAGADPAVEPAVGPAGATGARGAPAGA